MDVGFNNTNTFPHDSLKDVVFLVEATSMEMDELWKEYAKQRYDFDNLDREIKIPPTELLKSFATSFGDNLTADFKNEMQGLKDLIASVEKRNADIRESRKYRIEWGEVLSGCMLCVGEFAGHEIWVSFFFAYLNGHKVAFYEPTSQVVHHGVVENFLMKHFQRTHDGYTRWNHVDANNFHNCVSALDNLDTEPRDTVFKGYHKIEDNSKKNGKKKGKKKGKNKKKNKKATA